MLLRKATARAIVFARQFVSNSLPDACEYNLHLNQSYDAQVAEGDLTFPEDVGVMRPGVSVEEVVETLYRHGCCPVWIDISVEAVVGAKTRVRLLCAGRYSRNDSSLYYVDRGVGPFGIKGPDLPSDYQDGQKFALPAP
jgi:hypothetical protein